MEQESKIKPFSTLKLERFFEYDLEKIKMAYRLSSTIHSDLVNIRATGDQVELAVKDFYQKKLFPKYHVCDGHIIDKELKVSPQFDIIICESSKNPVLFDLADKSELVYFESVYLFGEVKKSVYNNNLISNFCDNIKRFRHEMSREPIEPSSIESGNATVQIETPLTILPLRNPLFSFMFFVDSSKLSMSNLTELLSERDDSELPNMIVFLDQGIVLNVDKEAYSQGEIKINLYPEYSENSTWVFLSMQEENMVLTYHYMMLIEHLNNSILSSPEIMNYTKNLFNFSPSDFLEL